MKHIHYSQLTKIEKELLNSAELAIDLAYSPYTHSYVGAAALTFSGKIISAGCMGNSSSTLNICAERAAIITANSLGHRDIKAIAISAKKPHKNYQKPLTLCGVCRQALLEVTKITGKPLIIFSLTSDKRKIIKTSIKELFPYPYSRY